MLPDSLVIKKSQSSGSMMATEVLSLLSVPQKISNSHFQKLMKPLKLITPGNEASVPVTSLLPMSLNSDSKLILMSMC